MINRVAADPSSFTEASASKESGPGDPAPSSSTASMPSEGTVSTGGIDHFTVEPAAIWHQIPFSRIGIGADISPLGIGIKGAIVLNHEFDGRLMGNFFNLDTGRFEIEGFNLDAKVHMASGAVALDWYPFGSVWRISPGLLFLNGNQISAVARITPGNSFSIEKQTYYSATPDSTTGAIPLTGTGMLGLHTLTPALTVTGGFGKFIPRSDRHWSFPSEFGVAFTGAPSINVHMSGWACLDSHQTQCSDVHSTTNPIGIQFNRDLQARLNTWRGNLSKVKIYPIFSYSVIYSFNIPTRR